MEVEEEETIGEGKERRKGGGGGEVNQKMAQHSQFTKGKQRLKSKDLSVQCWASLSLYTLLLLPSAPSSPLLPPSLLPCSECGDISRSCLGICGLNRHHPKLLLGRISCHIRDRHPSRVHLVSLDTLGCFKAQCSTLCLCVYVCQMKKYFSRAI